MTQPPSPPPASPPPPIAYATPIPHDYQPTADDRTMAMLIHLCLLFAAIASLIIWLIKKDQSPFINYHGKQALSFFIVTLIAAVVTAILCFFVVGICLLPVFFAFHIAFPIIAAVAANRGEWYVYPWGIGQIIK